MRNAYRGLILVAAHTGQAKTNMALVL